MKNILFMLSLCTTLLTLQASSDDDRTGLLINYEQEILASDCCNDPYCTKICAENKEKEIVLDLLRPVSNYTKASHEQKNEAYSNILSFIEEHNEQNKPLFASSIKTIFRKYTNQFKNTKTIYIDPLQNEFERLSKSSKNQQAFKKCSHCKRSINKLLKKKNISELTSLLRNIDSVNSKDLQLINNFLEQEKKPIESKKALTNIFVALEKNAQIAQKKETKDLFMCNIDRKDKAVSCGLSTIFWCLSPIAVPVQLGKIYCCALDDYTD